MDYAEYGAGMEDKLGISDGVGCMVGDDKFGAQKAPVKRKTQKFELKAYKELTEK